MRCSPKVLEMLLLLSDPISKTGQTSTDELMRKNELWKQVTDLMEQEKIQPGGC